MGARRAYAWPGNIRELQNVFERSILLADGELTHAVDLPRAAEHPTVRDADLAAISMPSSSH